MSEQQQRSTKKSTEESAEVEATSDVAERKEKLDDDVDQP